MARATQPFRINTRLPTPRLLHSVTAELAWIVLALSLGMTILTYCILHTRATHTVTDLQRKQANFGTSAIKARLNLSASLLRSAAAMLVLNRTVQNATWQQYQRNLANQGWPAEVQNLGYAQHIRSSEKTALHDAMRADAMPDYRIHPVRDASEHAPILFIAPATNNRAVERPGFDLLSSTAAKRALKAATDSGAITLHALDTGGSTQPIAGLTDAARALLVLPLFTGNAAPPTIALRRQQVIGFVFAFIGVNELLQAIDASPYRPIRLVALLDSTPTTVPKHRLGSGTQSIDVPFDLFGNRWQAEVVLPALPAARTTIGNAEIIALCGGVISLLLFAVIRLLASISRINRSHSKRTSREIRQLKQQLSASSVCSDHAIMTIDRRHRIMTFNPTAESIFGIGAETAIGIGLSRFLPHKLAGANRNFGDAATTGNKKNVAYRLPNNPRELARRYHGEEFPFKAIIYKCEHGGEPATMIFLKDMTVEPPTSYAEKVGKTGTTETCPDALLPRENLNVTVNPAAIHFEITVGESISTARFDWLSASPPFNKQHQTHDLACKAPPDDPSSINCQPTSVCEFINRCIHDDDRAMVKQLWRRAFRIGSDVDCLYRMLTTDGGVQVMRHWMTPAGVKSCDRRFVGLLFEVPQEVALETSQHSQPEALSAFQMNASPSSLVEITQASQVKPYFQSLPASLVEVRHRSLSEIPNLLQQASYSKSSGEALLGSASHVGGASQASLFLQHGERRRQESTVIETGKLYRQLQSRLLHFDSARDAQQKKLAREMHDDFGQLLTAMKMDLIALQTQLAASDSQLSQQLGDISSLVDTMVISVRRIIANLPPEQIEEYGLVKGLELLANAHSNRYKIRCRLHVKPHLPTLDAVLISPIYRIVQEALNNIAKHARATEVTIGIEYSEHLLQVRVIDDGCGISPSSMIGSAGFGLIGMRERVNNLNGKMTIDTANGLGTTIHITIPLEMELMS